MFSVWSSIGHKKMGKVAPLGLFQQISLSLSFTQFLVLSRLHGRFGWNVAWLTHQCCLLRHESIRSHKRRLAGGPVFCCFRTVSSILPPLSWCMMGDHRYLSLSVWESTGESRYDGTQRFTDPRERERKRGQYINTDVTDSERLNTSSVKTPLNQFYFHEMVCKPQKLLFDVTPFQKCWICYEFQRCLLPG